jgi:hypothetical protein
VDPSGELVYGGVALGASTILRAAAIAALLVGSVSRAHADGAVLVVGTVSPRDRDVIVDTIKGEGSALSLRFSAPAGRDAADASVACLRDKTPWSCVAPVIRGKDQLVIVEVDSEHGGGAPMTIVTAHLLISGDEAESFASRNCAMCNEDALKRTVGDLSRDLLQRAAARSGRTKLAIRSRPDRAQIVLDGRPAGATDTTLATYPGKHTIELQAPGYAAATREVIAVDGSTVDVAIPLPPEARRPGPGDPGSPDAHPRSRLLPGLAIGAGAAAIVAGGLLIAFDQDPSPSQRYYHNTAPYGVASLAAGVVVAGAGIYLWLRPRASSAAAVAPVPGGAAIGWAGRF